MSADMQRQPDADELATVVRAKQANRLTLMARPNVIGLDVGYRIRGGQVTDERVVKVYVSRKLDRSLLAEEQLIPSTVRVDGEEIGVDVEEGVVPQAEVFTLRSRPLRGGSSISADGQPGVGTLGACVTLNDGNTYILSNNHVLAGENSAPIGTAVRQPGQFDGAAPPPPADIVATLFNFVPIDFGSITFTPPWSPTPITIPNENRVDAALARVTPPNSYNVGNREIHWIGYPRRLVNGTFPVPLKFMLLGQRVCKMGRTTEFTLGTIVSTDFDTMVTLPSGNSAWFVDQFRVQGDGGGPFTMRGDSGSLVLLYDTGDPIGLHMAGGGGFSIANPLDAVLSALAIPQL